MQRKDHNITLFTPLSRARAAPRARPRVPGPPSTIQYNTGRAHTTPTKLGPQGATPTALAQTTHPRDATPRDTPDPYRTAPRTREGGKRRRGRATHTYSHQRHIRAGTQPLAPAHTPPHRHTDCPEPPATAQHTRTQEGKQGAGTRPLTPTHQGRQRRGHSHSHLHPPAPPVLPLPPPVPADATAKCRQPSPLSAASAATPRQYRLREGVTEQLACLPA